MKGKRKATTKIAAVFLCLAMVLTTINLPAFTTEVKAAEAPTTQAPSVTAFATKADLVDKTKFSLWKEDGGVAQKVNFGNGRTWYIVGADIDGSLVLLRDRRNLSIFKEWGVEFNSDWENGQTYTSSMGVYEGYTMPDGATVSPNHYGASDIRKYLISLYGEDKVDIFTSAEQSLMQNTTVYTRDIENENSVYYTSDKLYLAYGKPGDTYITVGANSASDLYNGIKVGLSNENASNGSPYTENILNLGNMWLRTPDTGGNVGLLAKNSSHSVVFARVDYQNRVVPALNMNLVSVLFASAANVASNNAEFSDAMTFRMDGTDKITSTAIYDDAGIKITKGRDDEYIYIQYKDETEDKVWSKKITDDMNIFKDCIGIDGFENCKIWIEKKNSEENLTYAVMATSGTSSISSHSYSDDSCIAKCAICGKDVANPLGNHNFEQKADDSQKHICKKCGIEENHQFGDNCACICGATIHNFSEPVDASSHRCINCGLISSHDSKNDGTCSICGYSEEFYTLSETKFATPQQLRNAKIFSLWKDDGGVAQKVNFGNKKTWYIAGADADGSLVLLCDPANPIKTDQEFNRYSSQKYTSSMGIYEGYTMTENDWVISNHYGASDIRKYLISLYGEDKVDIFTSAEQSLMQNKKIYTGDPWNEDSVYYTSDKLYLAYGKTGDEYITVGANSASDLYKGIKVGLNNNSGSNGSPYTNGGEVKFWLRTPNEDSDYSNFAFFVYFGVKPYYVGNGGSVVPALNMDMSSVLFASATQAASSNATFSDAMTFRMASKNEVQSSAIACTDRIIVTKGTNDDEYLYVQGNDGTKDWVYSKKITADETILMESIKESKSLADIDLTKCKIWIETKADNVTYAKEIVVTGNHDFIDSDGKPVINCTLCNTPNEQKCGEDVYYTYSEDGKTLYIYGTGPMKDYDWLADEMSPWCSESDSQITDVVISDGVTSIGGASFYGYKFTSIEIPDSMISIGDYAFCSAMRFTKIVIPDNVKTIGESAFEGCGELKNITFGENSKLESIGTGAFWGTPFSEIKIPNSVSVVGDNTFNKTDLKITASCRLKETESKWKGLCTTTVDWCHVFPDDAEVVKIDENKHGKECSICHEVVATGNHDFSESEYKNDGKGKHYRICALCTSESEHEACSGGTATCQKKAICSHCKTEYGELAAHTWDAGEITKAATCKDKGVKTFKCTVTGCTETKTEDVEIDSTNHVNTEVVGKKSVTCTEDGYTGDTHCKDCDTTIHAGSVITATGHTWNAGTVTTPATCKTKGVKTFKCTVEGCTGTKTEEIAIDANNHVNTEVLNAKDATCTEKGYTGDTHCKDCDTTVTGTDIAATGHDMTKTVSAKVPATCEKDGKEVVMGCKNCDHTEGGAVIKATGHKWDNGTVTKQPTVTAEGVKTFECTNTGCNETKTESIAKLPEPKKNEVIEDKTGNDYKVTDPNKKEVTYKAPANKKAKTVTIPASVKINGVTYKVTKVDDKAFKGNTTVTKVVIPSSVTVIGAEAFSGCKNLTTVSIPKNVTQIGKNAFKGCAKLTKVTLPSKCTKIGVGAFDGCKKMKTITIKSTKLTSKSVSAKAFKGLSKNVTIKVPKKQLKAYKSLLKKKGFKGKVK